VPRVFSEAAMEGFREYVYHACIELEFNLDEIGINEWEDRIEGKVIVPSRMRWQTICHGTHRNHSTFEIRPFTVASLVPQITIIDNDQISAASFF
jgi:hypothetical protein